MTRTDPEGYLVDDTGSLVYFLREDGGAGRVKIGRTKSLRSRFAALQTGSPEPLTVIHTEPGGAVEEAAFHRRWARFRIRRDGEWFHPAPPILAYVESAPPGRRGRLAPSLSDIPWRRLMPRRRRSRGGYAVRTLAGIARRSVAAAVIAGVLYVAGMTFAPDATATIVAVISSLL